VKLGETELPPRDAKNAPPGEGWGISGWGTQPAFGPAYNCGMKERQKQLWQYVGLAVLAAVTLAVVVYALSESTGVPMVDPKIFQ